MHNCHVLGIAFSKLVLLLKSHAASPPSPAGGRKGTDYGLR